MDSIDAYFREFQSKLADNVSQQFNIYVDRVMKDSGKDAHWSADVVQDAVVKMLRDFLRNHGMKRSENSARPERIDLDRSLDPLVLQNCRWVMLTKLACEARLRCESLDGLFDLEQTHGCDPAKTSEAKDEILWILDLLPKAFDSVTGPPKLAADAVRREPATLLSSPPNYRRIAELIFDQIHEVIPQATVRQWWRRARQQIREYIVGHRPGN